MNKNVEQFYIEWKANLDNYLKGYAYEKGVIAKKTRFSFLTLEKYLNKLLGGNLPEEEKIIILPGIRGVGKTTLLSQLYFAKDFIPKKHHDVLQQIDSLDEKFYISVDRLLLENISLQQFLDFLEQNVFGNLTNGHKKILLLIDEIQYDPKWDLFLKLLFDKTKGNNNLLVVATGSSAIFLNKKNKDLVRRSKIERVLPEKFIEYLVLHQGIYPKNRLSQELKNAIFKKSNAKEVFEDLNKLAPSVIERLTTIGDIDKLKKDYFLRGSFPFSAQIDTQSLAMERIKNMILTNIVQKDLILSGDFDAETLVKIPDTLFLLANSDEISTGNLANTLSLHSNTINKILTALVDTEILFELKPYGQPYKQIRKSSKFLFISPNIRAGLLNGFLSIDIKGKLLEDYLALIFEKEFKGLAEVYYDYGKGGADFILRFLDRTEIVIEVGFGKEAIKQVEKTMSKTQNRAKYGIVIGAEQLDIINENIVKIPLNYFLLM